MSWVMDVLIVPLSKLRYLLCKSGIGGEMFGLCLHPRHWSPNVMNPQNSCCEAR